MLTCMLSLLIIIGTLLSLSGCSPAAQPTINVPVNTMLPYHVEYEERMEHPNTTSYNWDGTPNSLVEMRTEKEYEFLAEVQIGRYQRCYANGEFDGVSIFTATITKVLDALDKKNTPKVGLSSFLLRAARPSAYARWILYIWKAKSMCSLFTSAGKPSMGRPMPPCQRSFIQYVRTILCCTRQRVPEWIRFV